jgi:O-antigen/teichoic acid export membrane protein
MSASDSSKAAPRGALGRRILASVSWTMLGRVFSTVSLLAAAALLKRQLDDVEFQGYILASFLVPFLAQLVNLGSTDVLLRVMRKSHVENDPAMARSGAAACMKLFVVSGIGTTALFVALSRFLREKDEYWRLMDQSWGWIALWFCLYSYCQIVAEVFRGRDWFGWSGALFTKSGGWLPNTLLIAALLAASLATNDLSFSTVMALHALTLGAAVAFGAVAASKALQADPARVPESLRETLGEEAAESIADAALVESEEAESVATAAKDAASGRDEIPARPGVGWMLRESWPTFVSVATLLAIEQLDVFLVGLFAGGSDVADYGVAKRCLTLVSFAFVTLAPALTPFVAELFHRGDLVRMEKLLRGASTLIGLPSIALGAGLFVFATPLLRLTFGPGSEGAALPLRLLIFGQLALVLAGHGNIVLIMTGRQRLLMRSTLILSIMYLAAAPIAMGRWGVVGASVLRSVAMAARSVAAAGIVRLSVGIKTSASLSPELVLESVRIAMRAGRRRGNVAAEPLQPD